MAVLSMMRVRRKMQAGSAGVSLGYPVLRLTLHAARSTLGFSLAGPLAKVYNPSQNRA